VFELKIIKSQHHQKSNKNEIYSTAATADTVASAVSTASYPRIIQEEQQQISLAFGCIMGFPTSTCKEYRGTKPSPAMRILKSVGLFSSRNLRTLLVFDSHRCFETS